MNLTATPSRTVLLMQAKYKYAEMRLNQWADAAGVPRENVLAEVTHRTVSSVRDWFSHADEVVTELRSNRFANRYCVHCGAELLHCGCPNHCR